MSGNKPNIVFIFADQMRAQATGYAGDPNVQTPKLDQLASESLVFTNAISNCPICTPYRACLMTGQYPLTHGLFMNDLCLPNNGNSLAQTLKTAGYETAYIGKWHLDGHGRTSYIPSERRQGFDHWKALECTHDYHNSIYYANHHTTPITWPGYDAFAQTDDAIAYLAQAGPAPFALFLSFGTPHDPYDSAPENLQALYDPTRLVLRNNVACHRDTIARKQLQGYYAHITALDSCVEKIDHALTKKGIRDNTIFVFTSDHGDMLESHWQDNSTTRGVRKQCPHDESVLVPLLLRFPQVHGRSSRHISLPIGAPDLMPTLLGMLNIPIPQTVQGLNLNPVIEGRKKNPRKGVIIANYHPFADWRTSRGGRPYRGIRTERHTFVRDLNGPWMLFDNWQDPFQLVNLVNQSSSAKIQTELDQELKTLLQAQNDAFDPPEKLRQQWNYKIDDNEAIPLQGLACQKHEKNRHHE